MSVFNNSGIRVTLRFINRLYQACAVIRINSDIVLRN